MTQDKKIKLRFLIIEIIFSLFFVIIAGRAIHLHAFKGTWLSEKAEFQYKKSHIANGKRGVIFDAKHREMSVSIDVTSIAANPNAVKDKASAAKALSKILSLNRQNIKKQLNTNRSFVWIKRHVSPKEVAGIKQLNMHGINFLTETARVYPGRTLAAQVIGFSGIDGQGLEGLEFYYNDALKGSTSENTVIQDALGRDLNGRKAPVSQYSGNNIVLTIDWVIQNIAESALEEAAETYSAKSGIAMVMNPKTGEILALAHYPRFNPNSFSRFHKDVWRNRAITDPFEPGSTMKIFLAAAAIESGLCTPSSIFYCEDGTYRIFRNVIHDSKPHGWLSLQQIVKYSSNIGTVKIAEMMGKNTLYNTLKKFGFGEKTGIDCPGETTGILSSYNRWTRMDTGSIAFGQGISVSAIQLIAAASAIANDGVLMRPYIVKAITDPNGGLVEKNTPEKVRTVISPETAVTIRRIMKTVITEGGTGVKAAIDGYTVCGKTGTAQKISTDGTYSKDKYIASFIGFAPVETPEVVTLVVINEPLEEHYGGIVAAPAFKKIVHETLVYLDVTPGFKKGRRIALQLPETGEFDW